MRRAWVILLVCACGRVDFGPFAGEVSDGVAPPARFRKPITLNPDTALTDFTAGILVASDPQLAAGLRPDARDLAFTAADGTTPLAFETESYDGAGTLVAWVRVPTLSPANQIYLYYGGPALDLQDPATTWTSYLGVWHLGDSGAAHDSTAHAHLLDAPASGTAPGPIAGLAGGARTFDGSSSLSIADPPDGSLDMGTRSFSISLWVLKSTSADLYDMVLYKGGGSAVNAGYDMEIGMNAWRVDASDGTTGSYATFAPTALLGRWVHLVGVYDRSSGQLSAYVDGTLQNMIDISTIGSLDTAENFDLSHSAYPFAGLLDEVRIYDHAVSPEWIAAEHKNLTMPGAFAALGAEQPAP